MTLYIDHTAIGTLPFRVVEKGNKWKLFEASVVRYGLRRLRTAASAQLLFVFLLLLMAMFCLGKVRHIFQSTMRREVVFVRGNAFSEQTPLKGVRVRRYDEGLSIG